MTDLRLPHLNMPDYSDRLHIRNCNGTTAIWDPVRSKWVSLTPEEWIRQNMTLYLSDTLGVSPDLMATETEIRFNGLHRRCDAVIYTPSGKPLVVAEYKRHNIPVTQKVFDQAAIYCMHLKVPYLIVSNGIQHLMCRIDFEARRYIFAEQWPKYSSLIETL